MLTHMKKVRLTHSCFAFGGMNIEGEIYSDYIVIIVD